MVLNEVWRSEAEPARGQPQRRFQADLAPLPEGLTPHSLRRTFVSILFALGRELPVVMDQVGHSDPRMTLGVYARVMLSGERERERLRMLVGHASPGS